MSFYFVRQKNAKWENVAYRLYNFSSVFYWLPLHLKIHEDEFDLGPYNKHNFTCLGNRSHLWKHRLQGRKAKGKHDMSTYIGIFQQTPNLIQPNHLSRLKIVIFVILRGMSSACQAGGRKSSTKMNFSLVPNPFVITQSVSMGCAAVQINAVAKLGGKYRKHKTYHTSH